MLENIGPRQSIILARLTGGPLENTGVMQGMSGSPVYIDGRLAGAVALSFPLSKEAIAGIRSFLIEDTCSASNPDAPPDARPGFESRRDCLPRSHRGWPDRPGSRKSPRQFPFPDSQRPRSSISPRSFANSASTPGRESPGGGNPPGPLGDPSRLEPGSMISVQLLSGDMSVGADGTVTCIDGSHIYAFGHRFLAAGPTELPFARSEVLALLPNLSASFKISTAREWMGTITDDRNAAIAGTGGPPRRDHSPGNQGRP